MILKTQAQGRCFLFLAVVIILALQQKTINAQEEIFAEVGLNASISCALFTNHVWWSFEGRNLTEKDKRFIQTSVPVSDFDENILTEIIEAKKTHNLHILKVKLSDEGNFTCHAFKTEGSSDLEASYFLQPVISAKIVGHNSLKTRVNISQSVTLFCLIEAYPLDAYKNHISWNKEDMSTIYLNNKTKIITLNETHINATLEITDVVKKDNGTYSCTILSEISSKKLIVELALLVLDVPQVSIDFVKAVGANKIFVNWTVNDGNDHIQKYFFQYMKNGTPTFTYYDHPIDGKNTSYVFDKFLPNTEYKLRIVAKNGNGQGPPYTTPQWFRTLENDPVFIPIVSVKGSTASTITIGWVPPPFELLDYIQYYELIVSEVGENSEIIEEAVHPQNSRNLPYMFDNLKTATEYEFKVRACSELTKLCGAWSDVVNGTTLDGAASEPLNINIICSHFNISRRNSVTITWDPPKIPNGKVVSYQVTFGGVASYRSEDGSMKNETWGPKVKSIDEKKVHKAVEEGVFPNTNYTVQVSAVTRNKKIGVAAMGSCTMPATVPDNVGRVLWTKIKTSEKDCVFKLFLPRISERNGPICCYRIFLVRINEYNKHLPPPEDLDILTYHEVHSANNTKGGAYLVDMFPGNEYQQEIFLGDGKRVHSDTDKQSNVDSICRKCFEGIPFRTMKTKPVKLTTPNSVDMPDENIPIIPELTQREQLTKAGNLTLAASKILENKRRRRQSEEELLKQNKSLNEITNFFNNNSEKLFPEIFDGVIDISSNYTGFIELSVRVNQHGENKVVLAYSNYFDMISPEVPESLEDDDNMSFILNIVVQVLCGLILLVLVLLTILCLMHRYYTKNSEQGEEVISLRDSLSRALCGGRSNNHRHLIGSALVKPADIAPISKNDLPQAYINRHKDTDYGFLREYEMLPNRFNDRTTKNSDLKENSYKNRYPDIKAYDQTRVKLSMTNSLQCSDYINANFVIGYKERKKFICAQGPMDSTINDFWRMIWEQHLEIIVMLTNLEEYNKAKCAKYWPEKILDVKQFGDITVSFASEHRFSDYLIRNLDIFKKNGNDEDEDERRQITQYHYLVWKDFMAPEHPHGIIKFIRQINAVYSLQRGAILVHCSAGVGRTGTLVALDSLIQQLEEEGQVSIFNTVCDLRHQRNFLVQSLKQYIFLYRALLDIAQFGNTELHARDLSTTIENLKLKPNDSKEKCKLEFEFEKIKSITDETNKSCAVGNGDENLCKNRSELVIPFDRNRVILTPIPTREHSTYINASFIEGYDNSESFIITQDPMENTICDFWRMISEQGVTTLVMISEIGDGLRKCPRYWADDEAQYDHILVKYMHSESCPYYTRREFNVTNCKINDTIKVTQFQYNGWPTVEGEVPEVCRGIIELVDQAQKHHNTENNFSTSSPIAVHCGLGTDRSSIFVAMCILVQQLRTEKKIDICTTTRKLRSQRSLLLDTFAQYEFLHRAIVNYADLHKLSLESPSEC